MSRPVDVLAVMGRQLTYLANYSRVPYLNEREELTEARAAVAELVEAADDYLNGEDPAAGCLSHSDALDAREGVQQRREARLRAALAKFGGAR